MRFHACFVPVWASHGKLVNGAAFLIAGDFEASTIDKLSIALTTLRIARKQQIVVLEVESSPGRTKLKIFSAVYTALSAKEMSASCNRHVVLRVFIS